jgi:hypothetical protein
MLYWKERMLQGDDMVNLHLKVLDWLVVLMFWLSSQNVLSKQIGRSEKNILYDFFVFKLC